MDRNAQARARELKGEGKPVDEASKALTSEFSAAPWR